MISDKAMLVRLNICSFSPSKTDKKLSKEVIDNHGAQSDAGKFVKRILPEEALEGIKRLSGEARTFHYANTLPWSDEGSRILPSAMFMGYNEKMRDFSRLFFDLVDTFSDQYSGYVEEARRTLNGMFNQADYPSADAVKNKFRFKTEFTPVPSSSDFRVVIHQEELAEMKNSLDKRIASAEAEAVKDLYQRLAKPLNTMVERLSDPELKFRDSLVSNVQEIIELIPALNITSDPVLAKLASEAKELTAHSPNRLRDDSYARKDTARKAKEILAKMAAYAA